MERPGRLDIALNPGTRKHTRLQALVGAIVFRWMKEQPWCLVEFE